MQRHCGAAARPGFSDQHAASLLPFGDARLWHSAAPAVHRRQRGGCRFRALRPPLGSSGRRRSCWCLAWHCIDRRAVERTSAATGPCCSLHHLPASSADSAQNVPSFPNLIDRFAQHVCKRGVAPWTRVVISAPFFHYIFGGHYCSAAFCTLAIPGQSVNPMVVAKVQALGWRKIPASGRPVHSLSDRLCPRCARHTELTY